MPKRYALCVGINTYSNLPPNSQLSYARSDAESIAEVLQDPARGSFDLVKLLVDEQATKSAILQAFDELTQGQGLDREDMLLFFFSGHGFLDKQGDLCLVPHDAAYREQDIKIRSLVHAKDIEIGLGNSLANTIVMMLDACYSGAIGDMVGRLNPVPMPNLFLVGAARSSESAVEFSNLRHGVFTECLLRALNLPPDSGDWVTLGQVLSFITLEIAKFPTSQRIEVTNRAIDYNMPVARNPLVSYHSEDFVLAVQEIFRVADYEIVSEPLQEQRPSYFVASYRPAFHIVHHTGVQCLDNAVVTITETNVAQFLAWIEQQRLDRIIETGILVTRNLIPSVLQSRIAASGIAHWQTLDRLLQNLADFDKYLRRLVLEFERNESSDEPPLAAYYVDLKGRKEDKSWHGDMAEYVYKWLDSDSGNQLALLGQYGSGKTTFSHKLARDLAKKCLGTHGMLTHRIPVLVKLSEFPRVGVDLEAFITQYLTRRGVQGINVGIIQKMNEAGLILWIFDGFDEMAVHADEEVIMMNLAEVARLATAAESKILLTSRPEYFKSAVEEEHLLEAADLSARYRARYERIHLEPFCEEDIEEFLQKRIPLIKEATRPWTFYQSQIRRIHDLSDLSRRPVLLEMIVKTLPRLIARRGPINRATLYGTYLEDELRRQGVEKRRVLLIKIKDRLRMMENLAEYFYVQKPVGRTADQIQGLVRDWLSEKQREELEAHLRDFLNCSFLIREGDLYQFSHRSFVEYLTARAIASKINTSQDIASYRTMRQVELTTEVLDFLYDCELDPDQVAAVIRAANPGSPGTLGANLVRILCRLKSTGLAGVDLSSAFLANADLSGLNMSRVSLKGSTLTGADLSGTDLNNANLSSARADNARLVGCNLDHAILSHCLFDCADFTAARARKVRVDGIRLENARGLDALTDALFDISGRWVWRDHNLELEWVGTNLLTGKLEISKKDKIIADVEVHPTEGRWEIILEHETRKGSKRRKKRMRWFIEKPHGFPPSLLKVYPRGEHKPSRRSSFRLYTRATGFQKRKKG